MIAQFPDHNSLSLAYAELLQVGVPNQRIAPYFEPAPARDPDEYEHQSFLKQLYAWVITSQEISSEASTGFHPPGCLEFLSHGGTLNIKCPQLELHVVEIVVRNGGQLVG